MLIYYIRHGDPIYDPDSLTELGKRQAESPGGVGSDSGSWRVLAYQLMGQVQIGRETNPLLYDMANREGLTLNDEYMIFVEILQEAIHVFETDRQGFYREYTKWEKDEEKKYSKDVGIRAAAAANRCRPRCRAARSAARKNGRRPPRPVPRRT